MVDEEFIEYEEFLRLHRYNKSHVAKLLGIARGTITTWEKKGTEVLIIKRDHRHIPFVSYEKK